MFIWDTTNNFTMITANRMNKRVNAISVRTETAELGEFCTVGK